MRSSQTQPASDQADWREVSPGVFSREIPPGEREVDTSFLNRLIRTARKPRLKRVLIETRNRVLSRF